MSPAGINCYLKERDEKTREHRPICRPRREAMGEYGFRNDKAKALDRAIGRTIECSGYGVPRILGEAKLKP